MPVISTGDGLATIINVFTVAPANQQRLVGSSQGHGVKCSYTARVCVRCAPPQHGRHQSDDVCAVAHVEDYERMRERPDASPFLAEAMTIATFDPGIYEVVAVVLTPS
jgi:hypothetical protein